MYKRKLVVGIPEGCLIDLETTGLHPQSSEIVVFGYVSGNEFAILLRSPGIAEDIFLREVAEVLDGLSPPFYAYNLSFERNWLAHKLSRRIDGCCLMEPWKRKAEEQGKKQAHFWSQLEGGRPIGSLPRAGGRPERGRHGEVYEGRPD